MSLEPSPIQRLQELLQFEEEQALDDRKQQELSEILRQSDAMREAYVAYKMLEAHLELEYATPLSAAKPSQRQRDASGATPLSYSSKIYAIFARPTPFSLAVAALVIGLLITAMAFMVPPVYQAITDRGDSEDPKQTSLIVAQLTSLHEVKWAKGQVGARLGAHLPKGHRLQLEEGLIELTYRQGATVILHGPCGYVVEGARHGRLNVGKLTAVVTAEGHGFTIATPTASIVDIGTEFGVEVDDDGVTQACVYKGIVEMKLSRDPNSDAATRLREGQSAYTSSRAGNIRLRGDVNEQLVRQMPAEALSLNNDGRPAVLTWTGAAGDADFLNASNWLLNGRRVPRNFIRKEHMLGYDVVIDDADVKLSHSIGIHLGPGRTWKITDSQVTGGVNCNFHPISVGGGGSASIILHGKTQFTYGWAWDIQWTLHDQASLISVNKNPQINGVLGKSSNVNFVGGDSSVILVGIMPEVAFAEMADRFRVNGQPANYGGDPQVVEPGDNILIELTEDGQGSVFLPLLAPDLDEVDAGKKIRQDENEERAGDS